MKNNKNKSNKVSRFALGILCLAIIGVFGSGAMMDVMESFNLKSQLKAAKGELNDLNQGKEALVLEKQKLTDPAYVENYARGTHLLSKDDEQVFVLPKGK